MKKYFSQLIKQKRSLFVLLVVTFVLSLPSCELEEDQLIDELTDFEPDLAHCELAFPGVTGDRYQLNFDGEVIVCEFINGLYVYQGDIIIETNYPKSTKGAGIVSDYKRWDKNTVPYRINENLPDQNRVIDALNQYEEKTNISFVKQTDEENYVEFIWNEYGCSSNLGMIGGRQYIRIADWANTGNVMHEIGHALGLIHEHGIPTRNDSINIVWENIPIEKQHSFRVLRNCISNSGFDFNSIMLWSSNALAMENEKPTMTKPDGTPFTAQRDSLSEKDIEIINQFYPPFSYIYLMTNPVTNILNSSATCGGTIVEHYNITILAKGVCWSFATSNPNYNNNHTDEGSGTDSYTSVITGLVPGTRYYIRAYAFDGHYFYYGETKSFVAD